MNSDPDLKAVFHFPSLFTLFTATQALFLPCLLCISQHFTRDSLIPTIRIKITLPVGAMRKSNLYIARSPSYLAFPAVTC